MTYTVAIIGTGEKRDDPDRSGFAMAYRHAPGYQRLDDCEVVACADIVRDNAVAFAETFDIPMENVFEDYEQMLRIVEPDIVSVCVPPKIHAMIVKGCAESGVVKAVHCEKPMGMNPKECEEMAEACERNGVQLTVDHQRRFAEPMVKAKQMLDDGKIGELQRIETTEDNLFDAGCHNFDLAGFFTGQAQAEWVLAGLDYHEENIWFGAHNANQVIAQWRYENGVYGLFVTGEAVDMVGCYMRLVGTDGVIEMGVDNGPSLRYRTGSGDWTNVNTEYSIHGPKNVSVAGAAVRKVKGMVPGMKQPSRLSLYELAIEEVVNALREERTPLIDGKNAEQAMDLTFGSWESARRNGRVDLPLDIEDNPLEAMVESGQLNPKKMSKVEA
jgi:predicted dehydrogenase